MRRVVPEGFLVLKTAWLITRKSFFKVHFHSVGFFLGPLLSSVLYCDLCKNLFAWWCARIGVGSHCSLTDVYDDIH